MSKVIRLNDNNLKLLNSFTELCRGDEISENDPILEEMLNKNDNLVISLALNYAIMLKKQLKPNWNNIKSPK